MAKRRPLIDRESTFDGVVADMISEVENLRDEIGEWKDNLEERGRDSTAKYDEVSECFDALDDVANDAPEQPDPLPAGLVDQLKWQEKAPGRQQSRSDRLSAVTSPVRMLIDVLGAYLDEHDENDTVAWADADRDAWAEYHENLGDVCDRLDEVSFPGMFG